MKCFIDGNALCIVKNDFVNLQESKAMFVTLTAEQIREFILLRCDIKSDTTYPTLLRRLEKYCITPGKGVIKLVVRGEEHTFKLCSNCRRQANQIQELIIDEK